MGTSGRSVIKRNSFAVWNKLLSSTRRVVFDVSPEDAGVNSNPEHFRLAEKYRHFTPATLHRQLSYKM